LHILRQTHDRNMRYPALLACLLLLANSAAAQEVVGTFLAASPATLSRPHDLALSADGGLLYVADLGNHAVTVLDAKTLRITGTIGKSELSAPHDVHLDRAGRLLVADTGNNRIAIYTVNGAEGKLVSEIRDGISGPEGVAEGADGTLYVVNTPLDNVVALRDGRKVLQAGVTGKKDNQYNRPHDVEVDAKGNVYVVDSGNDRIQVLNSELKAVRVIGGVPFNFNDPKYLFIDSQGWLYVADQRTSRIKILNAEYRPVGVIGSIQAGAEPGQLNNPEGVLVHGDRIWISDTYNNRVVLYSLGKR